jgi:peroxiredoxin
MRGNRALIVLVLAPALAHAQLLPQLEKNVAAKPDDVNERNRLLNALVAPGPDPGYTFERVIELRRENILWLIRSRPAGQNWMQGEFLIPPRGLFADPEGYEETVAAWNEQISKHDAAPEVVANAAIYLKATDRARAREMLDRALGLHPDAAPLWRAMGMVDAAAMAGVDGLTARGQFSTDPILRENEEAKRARDQIENSANAFRLAGAAQMLFAGTIQNPFQLTFGDDDVGSLAGRWLRRAVAIAPVEDIRNLLGRVLRNEANRAEDPRERARLFSESAPLMPERDRPEAVSDLSRAEFEAGDDQAAARDASRALDLAAELVKTNHNQASVAINRANSVLGRVALARGDGAEARARLRASLDVPADTFAFRNNGPDLSLAQDLADAGERDAVIAYLEAARVFWIYDRGQIDRYEKLIRAGRKRAAFAFVQSSGSDLMNRPAPAFKLHDLDGKEWTLASIESKAATLIFWNAACKICAGQILDFSNAAGNARLFAINIGDADATVKAFIQEHHVTATVLAGGTSALAAAYHVDTMPSSVLIDARGRVARYEAGAIENPRQLIEQAARSPLAQPVPIGSAAGEGGTAVTWQPIAGAQSYLVEWEARDIKGWPSDRDGFLRVIPTRDTGVQLDSPVTLRWRVYAVAAGIRSDPTPWQVVVR